MEADNFKELLLSSPENKYFQLVANFQADPRFINIFARAIDAVISSPGFKERKCNKLIVFITNTDMITIRYKNRNQFGSQFNAAVILYDHMKSLSETHQLICVVEEFVHHFWNESDEVETSRIVSSLIPGVSCNAKGEYFIDA
ncbi:hypothetical protein LIT38_20300 [Bacillus sp. CMF12]|uniref:hypothetical protein n=1 Tax=Bacillus sp. CMF12 TaxID=2884834 RepID=UPI00207A8F67|nr:hypothetical protein [Bacillus sp. CMF12]USK48853.1 hypothetical protein LIT38_20300 [Bacillus sp. CMF12]